MLFTFYTCSINWFTFIFAIDKRVLGGPGSPPACTFIYIDYCIKFMFIKYIKTLHITRPEAPSGNWIRLKLISLQREYYKSNGFMIIKIQIKNIFCVIKER